MPREFDRLFQKAKDGELENEDVVSSEVSAEQRAHIQGGLYSHYVAVGNVWEVVSFFWPILSVRFGLHVAEGSLKPLAV